MVVNAPVRVPPASGSFVASVVVSVAKLKVADPSVFRNCPADPSAAGIVSAAPPVFWIASTIILLSIYLLE